MPFKIVRNDITKMSVDVVVNASNPNPIVGGGVDRAINLAAGQELIAARKEIGYINTGEAYITPAFDLPSDYVIHTVGPVWQDGNNDEIAKLESCYKNSLQIAVDNNCRSIAFPLISSGAFGMPINIALDCAVKSISEFLSENDIMIYLVVFDKKSFKISREISNNIESYIDENYIESNDNSRDYYAENLYMDFDEPELLLESKGGKYDKEYNEKLAKLLDSVTDELKGKGNKESLEDVLANLDIPFSEALIGIIDEKGLSDSAVYKKANIDRKLFSKIKNNKYYKPGKYTAVAFAIALELSLDETDALLGKAGYILSKSNKADVIIRYFIENKNYNIFEMNQVLFYYDQPLIGV